MRLPRQSSPRAWRAALVASLASLAPALAACAATPTTEPAPSPPPEAPAICKPPAALPEGGHFVDVTAEVGLTGVTGGRVTTADLDGDGLPDLVVHNFGGKREGIVKVLMNRGGKFVDETAKSGFLDSREASGSGRLGHLTVFGDVDNDGDLDAFEGVYLDGKEDAAAKGDRNEVRLNDGKGHFTFAEAGPMQDARLPTTSAAFLDADRDGKLDVFLGTFYSSGIQGAGNFLYKGAGDGSFTDEAESSGVLRPKPAAGGDQDAFLAGKTRRATYGVTACDVDGDGDTDLMVSAYGRQWNELWKNDGNGKFVEVGEGTPFAADDTVTFNDNEFYRCYCSTNSGKCPSDVPSPRVGCTNGAWSPGFDDQPARNGGNTFSTVCADLDGDGALDAFHAEIKHWHIGQSSDSSQMLRNDGTGKFVRVPNEVAGLGRKHTISDWNEGDIVAAAFDYDADGRNDVFVGSSDYPETYGLLFHQEPDKKFRELARDVGIDHYHAVGVSAADIDGDGDLDLIVATSVARCSGDLKCPSTPAIKVYRNQVGHKRNLVRVKLVGGGAGKSNRAGIGARVTVKTAVGSQVQEVSGGYGHFGLQHDSVLTFGLGDACAITEITVRWPNGERTTQTLTRGLKANTLLEISEGADAVVSKPLAEGR
ncbi:MAG TPA: CRTAC1 family protein [Polyangiaceae bacterium]|nr:CRTAC1 family protein [Polyangiaceae bacterium]